MSKDIDAISKNDKNKTPLNLIPTQIIRDVGDVREFGNKKYSSYSWVVVEKERYIAAFLRHFLAYMDDPKSVDEESGIPHYKHAACNMAFLCEMEREDWPEIKQKLIEKDPVLMESLKEENKKEEKKPVKVKVHRKKVQSDDCN